MKPQRKGRPRCPLGGGRGSAIVLALLLGGAAAGAAESTRPDPDTVGRADYAWPLETLDGETVRLSAYRGDVLVIHMWATWCAPCVAELATFRRLVRSMEDSDVRFLFVSPEDPEPVRRFLRLYGYQGLPVYLEGRPMPEAYGLEALPTTWIVDRHGRIVLKHRGTADWDSDRVRRFLLRLSGPA
ncbi:MAG: TlpA family protein disulfide reductase [Gemmatimonadota bacterium]